MLYDDDPRRQKHWPIWSTDRKVQPPAADDARHDGEEDEGSVEQLSADEPGRESR